MLFRKFSIVALVAMAIVFVAGIFVHEVVLLGQPIADDEATYRFESKRAGFSCAIRSVPASRHRRARQAARG